MRSSPRGLLVGAALAAGLQAAGPRARADGALPEAQSILLPEAAPARMVLATNFGLVSSDDHGRSWWWACETEVTDGGRLYGVGAGLSPLIVGVGRRGAFRSADGGCSWTLGGGLLEDAMVTDVFADPRDARRVLAVARRSASGRPSTFAVYESLDGGQRYDRERFAIDSSGAITGVEIARADPRVVFVTYFDVPGLQPRLARSADGGASWTTIDLEPALGAREVRLFAIDPEAPARVYLRAFAVEPDGNLGDRLAIFDAEGPARVTLSLSPGRFTAFARGSGGDLWIAGVATPEGEPPRPVAFRSRDRGETFEPWPLGFVVRGLAARGDELFVAADDLEAGFALASSRDGGKTLSPRLRLAQVSGVAPCLRGTCEADCAARAAQGLWNAAICGGGVVARGADGGAKRTPPAPGEAKAGGCGCEVGRGDGRSGAGAAGLLSAAALLGIARRGSRRRRAP